jgi:hypothetical protein
MAKPILQVERRLENLENAVIDLTAKLVENNTIHEEDADEIERTLRGETTDADPQS